MHARLQQYVPFLPSQVSYTEEQHDSSDWSVQVIAEDYVGIVALIRGGRWSVGFAVAENGQLRTADLGADIPAEQTDDAADFVIGSLRNYFRGDYFPPRTSDAEAKRQRLDSVVDAILVDYAQRR
ncbi:hypothetical protein [Curtobacterium sp. MCBD17_040]|uniref:hypothetical protein n=1 Tax=Curtobacterium sp. MCBD17_040 TaxID=2175674 RepID=UPI0015E8AF8A|nr:hypothetical protein [Curtobacterium sp. MCBD17_040]WIB65357.1 hypothetical protein DEI94_18290 [Curtobacterium sp. MCBD17_040]